MVHHKDINRIRREAIGESMKAQLKVGDLVQDPECPGQRGIIVGIPVDDRGIYKVCWLDDYGTGLAIRRHLEHCKKDETNESKDI